MKRYAFSLKGSDLDFVMGFLSAWFGRTTKISDVPPEEFLRACRVVLRLDKKEEKG